MSISYRPLTSTEPEYVYEYVAALFAEMYKYMDNKDLKITLCKNGEKIWINSIKHSLGKLNMVFIATDKSKIIGFAAGNIRLGPSFLGNVKIGYISHVFVLPKYRGSKVGNMLSANLISWFKNKKVNLVELEVLNKNTTALNFWEKLGFEVDNVSMKKII